ncbi:MAG: polysaccharide deacetylase family protein [Firmicutes bacterium]|nr:polysaccharide deacetylase family protein [Bacillota bacterium]
MGVVKTIKAFVKHLIAARIYRIRGEQLISQRRGIAILMYHEIAPRHTQVFRQFPVLCTAPDTFEAQVTWLSQHFEIISMDEALRRLHAGIADDSRAVVITSDDGWRGFYQQAMSTLQGHGATIYVTTGVLQGEVPWYVRWRLLLEHYPHLLRVLAHDLGRLEAFRDADSAIAALKQLDYARIRSLWHQAINDVPFDEASLPKDWFMRQEELPTAVQTGFTIGAHTVNHPILTHEFDEVVRREISESKQVLETLTGMPVRHFAYPNGDHNEQVVRWVAEAGYATAVTTQAGWNRSGSDVYRLRRFDVHETMCTDHWGRFSEAIFALYLAGAFGNLAPTNRICAKIAGGGMQCDR